MHLEIFIILINSKCQKKNILVYVFVRKFKKFILKIYKIYLYIGLKKFKMLNFN